MAHSLRAYPAAPPAGAEESGKGAWRGHRAQVPPPLLRGRLAGWALYGQPPRSSQTTRTRLPCTWGQAALARPRHAPARVPGLGSAGHSPGVAIHLDLVPGQVQVPVVHTRALLLHNTATTAVIQQPNRANTAADALRLVLQGRGVGWGGTENSVRDLLRGPELALSLPSPLLTLQSPLGPFPTCRPQPCLLSWVQHWAGAQVRAAGQGSLHRPPPPPPGTGRTGEAHVCGPSIPALGPLRKPVHPPPTAAPARTWPAASVWQLVGRGLWVASAVRLLQSMWIFGA